VRDLGCLGQRALEIHSIFNFQGPTARIDHILAPIPNKSQFYHITYHSQTFT
jgi:hypothetical protein